MSWMVIHPPHNVMFQQLQRTLAIPRLELGAAGLI